MGHFLSCDWGTSCFRLRLANAKTGKIITEEISGEGIANTFTSWSAAGNPDEDERCAFYMNIINNHIKSMETKLNYSLTGVKIIVSGMASSNIGIINIPYSPIPIDVNKPVIRTAYVPANDEFEHDVLIISGIKSDKDVVRGEETQLIGFIDPSVTVKNELFIFPGTHSKHIYVKDNQIIGFKTFMTGDLFELLSQKSILNTSVEQHSTPGPNDLISFKQGVKDALENNFLHAIFKVRINNLFEILNKRENFNYLSGLLIGTELKELQTTDVDMINLLCSSKLAVHYHTASLELGLSKKIKTYPTKLVDEAVIHGQLKIANQLNLLP